MASDETIKDFEEKIAKEEEIIKWCKKEINAREESIRTRREVIHELQKKEEGD